MLPEGKEKGDAGCLCENRAALLFLHARSGTAFRNRTNLSDAKGII
jgi:hypothetical protein